MHMLFAGITAFVPLCMLSVSRSNEGWSLREYVCPCRYAMSWFVNHDTPDYFDAHILEHGKRKT